MHSKTTTVQKSQEVSALLAVPDSRIIAGGTTFSPEEKDRFYLVDISGLEGLDGIKLRGSRLEIGPLASMSMLAGSEAVRDYAPALAEAAAAAPPEIRDRATIGGNLAWERIGDTAPALLACGAKLVIKTDSDYREILADRFWSAEGKNDLNYDEWIMRISLQIPRGICWGSAFRKTESSDPFREPGTAAAVWLCLDDADTVTGIRGGLRLPDGIIRRMFPLEKALKNRTADGENIENAVSAQLTAVRDLSPEEDTAGMLTDILCRAVSMAKERRSL